MNKDIRISITGKNPKFFLKRYIFNEISFNKYKEVNYNEIDLNISYQDYLKLKEIKSTYNIKIINIYGIKKFEYILKNNYTFLISFFIGILFLLLLSNIIFSINVIHSDKNIRNLVLRELERYNIKKNSFLPSYRKKTAIINKIIKRNKNKIEWLEIDKYGSKIIVKVTERKINKIKEENTPRDLIAKKDGIITYIEATHGEILKKENDYVKKGDIIVSGNIMKDETIKKQISASGKVYAEVWYNVRVSYPLNYNEIIYKDDVKNNININYFNKKISLRKNYENKALEKELVLIKSKVLPFNITLEKQRKIRLIHKKYSKNKALDLATNIAVKKIESKLSKDEKIISKKPLNLKVYDSKIEVDIFFKVEENITNYQKINTDILKENDEIIKE